MLDDDFVAPGFDDEEEELGQDDAADLEEEADGEEEDETEI